MRTTATRSARLVRCSLTATVLLAAANMSGCLIGSRSDVRTTGNYIGPQTFSQVQPGSTDAEWVLATFGEPNSRSTLSDGSEIWKWTYTKTKSGSGSLLFVYGGSDRTETQGSTFVQVRDGVVVKAWRD